jgi:phospholipid/cholesterol/gamma-HCH transport system permease protein
MNARAGWYETSREGDSWIFRAGGRWDVAAVEALESKLRRVGQQARSKEARSLARARIDLDAVDALDSAGAWLIVRTRLGLQAAGFDAEITRAKPQHAAFIERIEKALAREEPEPPGGNRIVNFVAALGKAQFDALDIAKRLVGFYGLTLIVLARVLVRPGRLRFVALIYRMHTTGVNALPIVGLLSFLIGVVVAFQGADQLRRFGAEIFTVNLLGVSILRELGVLITAILVAGRSGSAFTAQIGTMKVNQEVDAMETIGLDPVEILVVPRIAALVVTLPLLVFYANIMAMLGGMLMATTALNISVTTFVKTLQDAVSLTTFTVGMVKAPVFAFLIALVGCFEGFNVTGSAESVGRQTTAAVVESIFLVIVFDAAFSILFSILGI